MYQSITKITLDGEQCIHISQGGIMPPQELKTFMAFCIIAVLVFFTFVVVDMIRNKKHLEKEMNSKLDSLEEKIRTLQSRIIKEG